MEIHRQRVFEGKERDFHTHFETEDIIKRDLLTRCVRDSYMYRSDPLEWPLKQARALFTRRSMTAKPTAEKELEPTLDKLHLRKTYDIGITLIGGAAAMSEYNTKAKPDVFEQTLEVVADYFLRQNNKVFFASAPVFSGIMNAPIEATIRLQGRNPRVPLPMTIGVYPQYGVSKEEAFRYRGTWYRNLDLQWKFDISTKDGLERLSDNYMRTIPVKSGLQEPNPQDVDYEDKIQQEWRANGVVLCNVSEKLVKPTGKRVTIMYEGGNETAHELSIKLHQGERVIVIKNSGRLADIVSALKENKPIDEKQLKLYDTFLSELRIEFGTHIDLQKILENVRLIDVERVTCDKTRYDLYLAHFQETYLAAKAMLKAILEK